MAAEQNTKNFCILWTFEEAVLFNLKSKMAAEQNTKNFKCEICDYSTPKQTILNQHTNIVHLKMKNFDCSQCSVPTNLLPISI
jgi:hypothetical protein